MKYITHSRFKGIGACGQYFNISYGTQLEDMGNFIATLDKKIICYPTSENAHRYFACNDDGNGLERGKLTYAIAYSVRNKGNGKRFSNDEIRLLENHWKHFLRNDVDVILFNHDFFNADITELREMAKQLKIKIKAK